MAVEDVVGSVLQPLQNEGAFVPPAWTPSIAMRPANPNRHSQAAINALCHLRSIGKTPKRALCMDVTTTRASIPTAVGQDAGMLSMLGQTVRSRI
jgi:hypothetical protein